MSYKNYSESIVVKYSVENTQHKCQRLGERHFIRLKLPSISDIKLHFVLFFIRHSIQNEEFLQFLQVFKKQRRPATTLLRCENNPRGGYFLSVLKGK